MKNLLVLLFIIVPSCIYAQNNIVREYKIRMIGSPQTIYLIETENNEFTGYITSDFYRLMKRFLMVTIRTSKKIQVREELPPATVKNTMLALKSNGIEQLMKCEDDPLCSKQNFLDADHLTFYVKSNGKKIKLEFQSVYTENAQLSNIETIPLRRQAQLLITTVDKIIDLKNEFRKSLKKIKRPFCYQCGGISNCCVE